MEEQKQEQQEQENNSYSNEDIQKLIQSTVDKKTADFGKTIAQLRRENEQLKKASLTAEELQKEELAKAQAELDSQRAEFNRQKLENHAQNIIAKAGYGNRMKDIVGFVLRDTEENTTQAMEQFTALLNSIVTEDRQKVFKENGRTPKGAKEQQGESLAEKLGREQAEQLKASNEALNHYLGGRR